MVFKSLAKSHYSKLPFKGFFFSKLRTLIRLPLFIYQHLLFEEPFCVDLDANTSFRLYNATCIENDIFWNGPFHSWEQSTLFQWLSLCKVCQGSIIDVGANTGVFSLIAAASNKISHIIAFEPHPDFYRALCNNIKLNNLSDRVKAIQLALSDTPGNSSIADYSTLGSQISAATTTLDQYCEQYGIHSVDLIKADIEGMEPAFLSGAIKTIQKHRPTIIIEILAYDFPLSMELFLTSLGYTFFQFDDLSLSPPSPVSSLRNLHGNHRNFLLLGSVLPLIGRLR